MIEAVYLEHIMTKLHGQADAKEEAGPVLNLKMKMGLGRMTGVPAKSDSLASFYPATWSDFESLVFKMSQMAVFAAIMLDDHVVASRVPGFPIHVSELRIVRDPIIHPDDHAIGGSVYGLAEAIIIREYFPRPRMSQSLVISNEEIISVALIEDMPGVRVLPSDASALDMPLSFEWENEFRPLGIGSWFGQAA